MKIYPCLLLIGLVLPPAAYAHGEAHGAAKATAPISAEQHPWGRQGDPKKATRTVRVTMSDRMRFDPSQLTLKRGETVTFVVHNAGKLMHEFVIGTPAALGEHAQMMMKNPGMEHDEPFMAHVAPGKTQRISWTFSEAGDFLAGCLVAGHWDAGMKADLQVKE
ncbi:MAG: cupredoxin domain-containing protein [Rubrivivax sp.]